NGSISVEAAVDTESEADKMENIFMKIVDYLHRVNDHEAIMRRYAKRSEILDKLEADMKMSKMNSEESEKQIARLEERRKRD
ncbi:hypothetical protein PENTCL1PPCAC_10404, partial [Pristionchus entomophagus]